MIFLCLIFLLLTLIGVIRDGQHAGQGILSLIGLVSWIALWIQIQGHRKKLIALRNKKDNDSLIFNDQFS